MPEDKLSLDLLVAYMRVPEHTLLEAKEALRDYMYQEFIDIVSNFEVESLASDDPKLVFWQGYHQAQLDITNKLKALYQEGEKT